MNLLKSFSATTGLEPGDSYLYESLYPLDFNKYIVLDTQSTNPNFHYVFWFRVVELIEPILSKHNIKIVHFIEDKRYHFNHTYVDNSNSLSPILNLLGLGLFSPFIVSFITGNIKFDPCLVYDL